MFLKVHILVPAFFRAIGVGHITDACSGFWLRAKSYGIAERSFIRDEPFNSAFNFHGANLNFDL